MLAQGFLPRVIALLEECQPSLRRDLTKAKALSFGRRTDEALRVLVQVFYSADFRRSAGKGSAEITALLTAAARDIDPGLYAILNGSKPEGEDAATLLKCFYFAPAEGKEPLGRTAMTALDRVNQQLKRGRTLSGNDYYLQFLKAYSSASPVMRSRRAEAVGGGYFLCAAGYGCVIDPGHHFLDNFFRKNHSIDDIDAVIVTHFHDDHYADLAPLLSLLYRSLRGKSVPRKIAFCCDYVTACAFATVAEAKGSTEYLDCRRLGPGTDPIPLAPGLVLHTLPTDHYVFGDRRSGVGLVFELQQRGCTLVITGDTAWTPEVGREYTELCKRCRGDLTLVAHVSSVSLAEIPFAHDGPGLFHENHLCIHGLCKAIEALRPKNVFLSEVGEELASVVEGLARLIGETYTFTECRCYQCGDKYSFVHGTRVGDDHRFHSACNDDDKRCGD